MNTRPDGSPPQDNDVLRQDGFYVPTEGPSYPLQTKREPKGETRSFPFPGTPANPWQDAAVEPTEWPILTLSREGRLGIVDQSWNKSWACIAEYEGIVRWKTIELPRDVFGSAAKDGVTLT